MRSNGIGDSRRTSPGGMLVECSEPGCVTLTLGGTCILHDPVVATTMPRGVPHCAPAPMSTNGASSAVADPPFAPA